MGQKTRTTKEERYAFYAEHDKMLERYSALMGVNLSAESQSMVDDARNRFGYSPKTYSRDILGSLLRGWRKWRKNCGSRP